MWGLVILLPAVPAYISTLLGATGGQRFVAAAFGVDLVQRRAGYKSGEGWSTPRDGGWKGNIIAPGHFDAEDGLSTMLSMMAGIDKEGFQPFINKRYTFTQSEGKLLRQILNPAEKIHRKMVDLARIITSKDDYQTELAQLNDLRELLLAVLIPVKEYLREFPARRVHKIISQEV